MPVVLNRPPWHTRYRVHMRESIDIVKHRLPVPRSQPGNVQLNWPKLFQAFSVNFTLIFFHECVHSIIPHQHM